MTSTIAATVNGVAAWTDHTLAHPWPTPTTANLRVGVGSLYQTTSGEVLVDNVVVRVE